MDNNGRKMYVMRVRDAESTEQGVGSSYDVEYAVVANTEIVGVFEWGPLSLAVWEMRNFNAGQDRWLCLRLQYRDSIDQDDSESRLRPDKMSRRARQRIFYHGGGAPEEIVALASLFLRRRLRLGPRVRWRDKPVMTDDTLRQLDDHLIRGRNDLAELEDWWGLLEGLKTELHMPFILAARMYQQALVLIDDKPDFAYLNLVTAIEALSNRIPTVEPGVGDYDRELAMLIGQVGSSDLRKQLEERILEHLHQGEISLRFCSFIVEHVDVTFWDADRPEQGFGLVEPDQLELLMKRVYNQRSKTLHEGRSFPDWIFREPFQGEEMPLGLGIASAGGVWAEEDYFPLPHFMERLTRHVLINFLRRNQVT